MTAGTSAPSSRMTGRCCRNLTLNLGLRWDYFTPYAEVNGHQANFIPPRTATALPAPTTCRRRDARSRAPRPSTHCWRRTISRSIASTASHWARRRRRTSARGSALRIACCRTLVVRGGYGITYGSLGNLGYGGTLGTNYPFVYTATFNSPDSQHPLQVANGQTATIESRIREHQPVRIPRSTPARA